MLPLRPGWIWFLKFAVVCAGTSESTWAWVGAGEGVGGGPPHAHALRVHAPPPSSSPPARPLARLHGSAVPVREPSLRRSERATPPPRPRAPAPLSSPTDSQAAHHHTVRYINVYLSHFKNQQHNEKTAHFSQRAPPSRPSLCLSLSLSLPSDAMRLCRVCAVPSSPSPSLSLRLRLPRTIDFAF